MKMKNGPDSIVETVSVDICEGFSIVIRPLSLAWDLLMAEQLPTPPEADVTASSRHNRRLMILMVAGSLMPGQIEFETDREGMPLAEYADAILEEFSEFGLDGKRFLVLCQAVQRLNNYAPETIEQAKADFFEQAAS